MILATDAFNIVMTIFILIVTALAIFGLFKLAKHNERKYKEEISVLSNALVTRAQFKTQLESYINRVGAFGSFAVFLFDIDDFSGLNETYGQERCDILLKMFAERVTKSFDTDFVACRIGADRIIVLYKGEAEYNDIDEIANNAMAVVRDSYPVGSGEDINLTCSVGIALYPTCGATYKELTQSLELAAYVAKRDGGNRYVVSNSDIKEEETSNLEYFKEVRRAMDNNEFLLYYQPIINMRERKIYGFESFLRWNHPKLGILTPDKFIHVLEHSGDINFISKWGVEQLFKKLMELDKELGTNEICMTHNLSTKQLMSETLTDEMRKLIHKYKVDPSRIVLEVIEYAMYEKVEIIRINLLKLRDLGFRISVDGLGLDYNTLSQIEKEPIDILKLDKEFLENIENNFMKEKFVEMLVESSIRLNRIVISEGIEEAKHVKYILDNKISIGQGYFFSKPFEEALLLDYINNANYIDMIKNATEEKKESKTVETKTDVKIHEAKPLPIKASIDVTGTVEADVKEAKTEPVEPKTKAKATTTKAKTVKKAEDSVKTEEAPKTTVKKTAAKEKVKNDDSVSAKNTK